MSVTPVASHILVPVRSSITLAQTLKNRTQQRRISVALDTDRHLAWELNVNRTGRHWLLLPGRLPCLGLARSSHCDRKQSYARSCGIHQLTALESTTPLEHLVRVQPMSTCNKRHARVRLQRQIYDLPLLSHGPRSANATCSPFCVNYGYIVRPKPLNMPEGRTERLHITSD